MNNIIVKSGIIKNNEEWKGNIIITDDIIIPQGINVIVHPNTRIKFKKKSQNKLFNKNYKINYLIKKFNLYEKHPVDKISIIVHGVFIINGKKDEIVDIGNDGWNGTIYVSSKAKLSIKYTRIRYGFGIICDINSKTTLVDSCVIEQCCLGIVSFSKILIRKSRINYNDIGIICFNKFIVYKNMIVDNFYSGIKIISQKGFFSKNIFSLNNIGTDIFKSDNIKLSHNHYEFNNIGTSIDNSHDISFNCFLINNFINIYVSNYSYNITITCFAMLYIGIYVDDLSEVEIRNSIFINLNSMLFSSKYSTVIINNVNVFDAFVAIISQISSYIYIEKTNIKAIKKCAVLILNSDIAGKNNVFNSKIEVFTNLNSKIFIKNSKVESTKLICMANKNSDMIFDDVYMKSKSLFYLYNKSNLTLINSLSDVEKNAFCLTNESTIFFLKSKIKSSYNKILELTLDSFAQIKDSEFISEKGGFIKIRDNAYLNIETSKIKTLNHCCEIDDFGKLYIRNSLIKNKEEWLIDARKFSSVNIENSKMKSYYGIRAYDNAEFKCKNSSFFVLNEFVSSHSNSKITLKNNNMRLFDSVIDSFGLSEIQLQLNNKIFSKNILIKINEYSNIAFSKSNFIAIKDIKIIYENIVNNLKDISLKAKNIFISNKNNICFELGESKIVGNLKLNMQGNISICNSLIKGYSFINKSDGIIKIINSDIENKIDVKYLEYIEIENSKIGNIKVSDNSQISIKSSELKGDVLEVRKNGEVNIDDTILQLNRHIDDEENGRIRINDSKVYSGQGIRKKGNEKIEIKSSEIESDGTGIIVERGEIEVIESKVRGKVGIEVKEKGELKHKGLEIESDNIGFIYSGDKELEIEGIKIASKNIALKSNIKGIRITDSDIEGKINVNYIEDIEIENSKIGNIKVSDNSQISIRASKIKGEFLEVRKNGGFNIDDTILQINGYIDDGENGKIRIKNSKVYSGQGIRKKGNEKIEIKSSEIESDGTGIIVERGEIEVIESKVRGKVGIEVKEKGELKHKGLEIESDNIGLVYSGDKELEIEGIKIVSKDIALKNNSKGIRNNSKGIRITDSDIEGEIYVGDTEDIEIENSNFGNINVNDNAQISIRASKIKGDVLEVGKNVEAIIDDTILQINGYIDDRENGKIRIKNSKVYSGQGIRKKGNEKIEIKSSEIESDGTGIVVERGEIEVIESKVRGKVGIEVKEKGELKHKGLEIESDNIGFVYSGDKELEIEGIKIVSKDMALKGNCEEIKVVNSAIEGDIDLEYMSSIIIGESKICGKIKNASNINIEKCDLIDEETIFKGNINIIDTNINSNIINIDTNGDVFIDNSNIITVKGLYKHGPYGLICNNSNIYSDDVCLNIAQKSCNIFNKVSLNSKSNYSVVANNTNIKFNNSKITSKKGLLCEFNTNCEIKNMKADILFNFCNISKTNLYVDGLDSSVIIPRECFFIENSSKVEFKNINLRFFDNPIYNQFFNQKAIIYLFGDSKLLIDSLNFNIQIPKKMYFLRSDGRSKFELDNINISGLHNFLYMGNFTSGYIYNSKINTKSVMFSMYQNSNLNIKDTELLNSEDFKFIIEDNSSLSLENINIYSGQFISMAKNSQVYMSNSSIKLNDQCCKMQGNTCFEDNFSKWQIDSKDTENYAFYLLNNATMIMNLSNVKVKEMFAYCLDKSCFEIDYTDILCEVNKYIFLLEDKSKLAIKNSNLKVYSIAQLRNYANILIEKSSAYIKDVVIDLIGNSKAFIQNVLLKNTNESKTAAFQVLHNAKINIKDSRVYDFYIGMKYENKNNITIENTKINSKNKMLFTNDKRFLSFSNPIQKSLLYKLQQIILSTNNIFPLNKIYDFIYSLSISVYKLFIDTKKIQSLYLRRGMLNNWIAGSSDIDYLTILKQADINVEYNTIFNIKKRYKDLKKIFPFYGENLVLNERELDIYLKYGGIRSKILRNSKLLKGKKQDLTTDITIDLKYKTDIVKEILNSYILLSNNYFYNIDIISDICFSKAATDILKYIEYFYDMKDLDKSRMKYLSERDNDITNKLYKVLKNNIVLNSDDRNNIYNYIFNKLEKLSVEFNKEIILNNTTRKINVNKKNSISFFEELNVYRECILSIVLDDPGLAYIVLTNSINKNEILSIYKKAKENYCFYNTPILFFTENMYQMLLLSNFKNNPFEFCKQCNMSDKYSERRFYINKTYRYYYHNNEILKKLVISSLSEKAVQINEIDVTKEFNDIKAELYYMLIDYIQFYLYLKNDKIIDNLSSINNSIEEYKKYNKDFEKEILFLFEDGCKLKDEEKIKRIIVFIKNLKNEMMENYE